MKTKNINIVRGDDTTIQFKLLGDYTSNTVYFTIKETRTLTDVRYTDLSSSNGITATYDSPYTTFVIVVPKEDLQALTFDSMVWDLVFDENETPLTGGVNLQKDVRTPYDGLPVPEDDLRYVLVDTSEFNENDFIYFDGTSLVNISSYEARQLLCEEGSFITTTTDIYNLERV